MESDNLKNAHWDDVLMGTKKKKGDCICGPLIFYVYLLLDEDDLWNTLKSKLYNIARRWSNTSD